MATRNDKPQGNGAAHRLVFCGDTAGMYNRDILRAVAQAAHQYFPARIYLFHSPDTNDVQEICALKPLGILVGGDKDTARIYQVVTAVVQRLHIPVVDVSAATDVSPFQRVISDDVQVGRIVAAYFMARGYRRLAFCGDEALSWSIRRYRGFTSYAQEHGILSVSRFNCRENMSYPKGSRKDLSRWLTALPDGCALFASNDRIANGVIEACCTKGLRVPEDIAVVGCDNDDLFGQLHSPPISSVMLDTQQIGHNAINALATAVKHRRGKGRHTPGRHPSEILIPPLRIITRRSSDLFAVDDKLVQEALQLIRRHLAENISSKTLLYKLSKPISRLTLYRRFMTALGRSPAAEINRVRFETAMRLLQDTPQSISKIAEAAGFASRRQFTFAFHREVGVTPRNFRERHLQSRFPMQSNPHDFS